MSRRRERPVNPPFNPWRGFATVTAPPPFTFPGTTIRYFPLKADMGKLQRFCDNFLNVAPEFAVFRPLAPVVMLCVANYGRMSQATGNLGWTSQNELFFAVPVRWYQRQRDGKLRFKGFAQNAPFIYVDNESSQVEGREVFGWPKVQGWFDNVADPLTQHPMANREVLRMSTHIFDQLYRNERPQPRDLIVIEEHAPPNYSSIPIRPGSRNGPIMSLARNSIEWLDLMMQGATSMFGPLWGGPGIDDLESMVETAPAVVRSMQQMTRSISANTINLKQFRDAEDPEQICYQALTNAQVRITRIRESGLLGEGAMLRGDLSGGFRVRVHRHEALPIVETLGLEVEEDSPDSSVATLKPLVPFWQEMDLLYQKGQRLCWRTNRDYWRNDHRIARPRPDKPDYKAYNTTGSAAFQVATGPFAFPETRVRVLPLLADPGQLETFCDTYLNNGVADQTGCRYRPYGRYVYMTVMAFDEMASATNNMGRWARTEVDFLVPVRCFENGRLTSIALISPFMYSDSDIGTTTAREVNGWPMLKARMTTPTNPWLSREEKSRSDVGQIALEIEAVSAINTGQETTWHKLLEVVEGFKPGRDSDWDTIAGDWGQKIKASLLGMEQVKTDCADDFDRMRALALEVIALREPINTISLKQFRSAADALDACYQAHVSSPLIIQEIHDLKEIERPLHVRIHRVATQPIVETLGLVVKYQEIGDAGIVDVLETSRPFYLRADLETRLGNVLCERAESMTWQRQDHQRYFDHTSDAPVAVALADKVDSKPGSVARRARRYDKTTKRAVLQSAAASDVEPQMIVSAMLSREWNDHGTPRSRRGAISNAPVSGGAMRALDRFPDFVLRRDALGGAAKRDLKKEECVEVVGDCRLYWSAERALDNG